MLSLLAQESSSGGAAGGLVGLVLSIGFTVLILASMWKIFAKMTQPG